MPLDHVSIFCFGASYVVALACDLLHLAWPAKWLRWMAVAWGFLGLLAQSLYLGFHPPALSSQVGSLLLLAWILTVFYLFGSIHHRRRAWGVFVLPLVVGLVILSRVDPGATGSESTWALVVGSLKGSRFWRGVHYALLLLGAVGVCVGFVSSVMYLVQARRLRAKVPPGQGLALLSLERLEEMNLRAITLAFPLLTAGVMVGLALMFGAGKETTRENFDWKVLATGVLWFVFALMFFLLRVFRLRGRRIALLNITAFLLLLLSLASEHSWVQGGQP
jgi:ABC-type transport system involved in cytochrome c biogenesis permease subunit